VPRGRLTSHFREDAPKARPLVVKAPVQCSGTHVQPRRNLLKSRLSVTKFAGKAATNCVCGCFAFWQILKHSYYLSLENGLQIWIGIEERDGEKVACAHTRSALDQLALFANVACDLDGRGKR
jgi:hypothetical protein